MKARVGPIWEVSWKVSRGSTTIAGRPPGWQKNLGIVTLVEPADVWQAGQTISIWIYGQASSISG